METGNVNKSVIRIEKKVLFIYFWFTKIRGGLVEVGGGTFDGTTYTEREQQNLGNAQKSYTLAGKVTLGVMFIVVLRNSRSHRKVL